MFAYVTIGGEPDYFIIPGGDSTVILLARNG